MLIYLNDLESTHKNQNHTKHSLLNHEGFQLLCAWCLYQDLFGGESWTHSQ